MHLGYEVWLDPPNEIYMKYYFHHIANPEDIKCGAKPSVVEIGPYVYKERRIKKNIVSLGDEEIVYGQWTSYTYDQVSKVFFNSYAYIFIIKFKF